ncbi:MAG: hypothetical protein ABIT61_01805 [Steroidobacteraceae bacterium]
MTAEGVETAEQALLLTEMRCDSLQGWFVGRPVPPEKMQEFRERVRTTTPALASTLLSSGPAAA